MKKAVILLSGGLDSTTCLAIAKRDGFDCYALSFNYGQRHVHELQAAIQVAKHFAVTEHRIVNMDIGQFGGSALTDTSIAVPKYQASTHIPITYVPARNTIFLSFALGYAEVIKAYDIYIGVNAIDYSNYPDCRPEFIDAFQSLTKIATKAGVEGQPFHIHTPLLHLNKKDIIELGLSLGVDYGQTVSCYQLDPQGKACGQCDSCVLRQKGFQQAHVADPTRYTD